MNLAAIEATVYDRLNLPPTPDTTKIAAIRRDINTGYRQILAKPALGMLRRQLLTFTSYANTPFTALPMAVEEVYTVADRTRNWLLQPIGLTDTRRQDPGLITQGYSWAFAAYNLQAAAFPQPAAASTLWVVSSSAADNGTITVYVEVILSDGSMTVLSAALNGTSDVQLNSAGTVLVITKAWIALTATGGTVTATGTLTFKQLSGAPGPFGTTYASILPGRSAARVSVLHLYPTPSAAVTYTADCKVIVTPLANGGDEPLIPLDFRTVLAHYAIMAGCQGRENTATYQLARAEYRDVLAELVCWASKQTIPTTLHNGIPRYSQLGAYFPPGS